MATSRTSKTDRKPSIKELTEEEIQKLAQAKFVASAAIDAAVALNQAQKGPRVLNRTQLKQKMSIQLTDVREELLIRIAEGESVFTVCQDDHMPARSTVYTWIRKDSQFRDEYEAALHQRADKYVELIADLSAQMNERAKMGASNEEVTALKSHINSLQWIAARLHPKKYGDKQHLEVDQTIKMDDKQIDTRLQALIEKAKSAKKPE